MTDYKKLKNSILFSGMKEEEIRIVLGCLSKRVKRYEKGSIIFQVGDGFGFLLLHIKAGAAMLPRPTDRPQVCPIGLWKKSIVIYAVR